MDDNPDQVLGETSVTFQTDGKYKYRSLFNEAMGQMGPITVLDVCALNPQPMDFTAYV
jgi:plastocyanin